MLKSEYSVNTILDVEGDMNTSTNQSVDISMLISLIGDDKDGHCALFEIFISHAPKIIREIQSAHQSHKIEVIGTDKLTSNLPFWD